jgi:hypothetical protein
MEEQAEAMMVAGRMLEIADRMKVKGLPQHEIEIVLNYALALANPPTA